MTDLTDTTGGVVVSLRGRRTDTLTVSEVFRTVQGEGPSTGQLATFVRLGGCNLHCAWCDSAYTWDARDYDLRAELHNVPAGDVLDQVVKLGAGLLVVTGGEPLLHQAAPGFRHLFAGALTAGMRIEVETNATITPSAALAANPLVRFNASPKLAHAGDPAHARIRPDVIAALVATRRAVFKFVCTGRDDLVEVAELADRFGIPAESVWIMPVGTSADEVLARGADLADPAIAAGYNLTTRLHVLLWADERGR